VTLWHAETGKKQDIRNVGLGILYSVTFSPDGKMLATGNGFGDILLWDVKTFNKVATLKGGPGGIRSLAFSPDGKILAGGRENLGPGKPGVIKLWEMPNGKEVATLSGHKGSVFSVAFSPDGKTLASSSGDKADVGSTHGPSVIKLWNVQTRMELATLKEHKWAVFSVAFSPDGKTLASGSWVPFRSSEILLWDVETRKVTAALREEKRTAVSCVVFSRDGTTLVAGGGVDKSISLWDVPGARKAP
jgi:WD40 repeat protein